MFTTITLVTIHRHVDTQKKGKKGFIIWNENLLEFILLETFKYTKQWCEL